MKIRKNAPLYLDSHRTWAYRCTLGTRRSRRGCMPCLQMKRNKDEQDPSHFGQLSRIDYSHWPQCLCLPIAAGIGSGLQMLASAGLFLLREDARGEDREGDSSSSFPTSMSLASLGFVGWPACRRFAMAAIADFDPKKVIVFSSKGMP